MNELKKNFGKNGMLVVKINVENWVMVDWQNERITIEHICKRLAARS